MKHSSTGFPITAQDLETYPWLNEIMSKIPLHTWTDVAIFLDVAMGTFRQSLEEARRKLATAQAERETLDKRIADLQKAVDALASLCDAELGETAMSNKPLAAETGFSDAVRFALKTAKVDLAPVEVKEKMDVLGYDFEKYETDPLASIHTILKRLVKKGEAQVRRLPHNRTTYKWLGENQRLERSSEHAAATNDERK